MANDAALRRSIEGLIRTLELSVLENQALLAAIVDRDLTIEQLRATIDQLQAELRRPTVSSKRTSAFARVAGIVLMNAVVSFSSAAGGTAVAQASASPPQPQQVQLSPQAEESLRDAIAACQAVEQLALESAAEPATERRDAVALATTVAATAHVPNASVVVTDEDSGKASEAERVEVMPSDSAVDISDAVGVSDSVSYELRTEAGESLAAEDGKALSLEGDGLFRLEESQLDGPDVLG